MRKALLISGVALAAAVVAVVSFRSRDVPTLLALRLGPQLVQSAQHGPWLYRVRYKGGTAYLLVSGMPDDFDTLYTPEGWEICKPSGGLAGDGDGGCPDALDPKEPRVLVWPSKRKSP
jgi:hypothetical protein